MARRAPSRPFFSRTTKRSKASDHEQQSLHAYEIPPVGPNKEGTKCSWYNLEEDLETVVVSFLQYHDALAYSLTCNDFLRKEHHIHNVTTVSISTKQGLGFFHQLTEGSRALPSKSMRQVTKFQLYVGSPTPPSDDRNIIILPPPPPADGMGEDDDDDDDDDDNLNEDAAVVQQGWRGRRRTSRGRAPTFAERLPKFLKGFRHFFPSLTQLDLGGNAIGLRGATELAAGMKGMNGWPSLRHVNLRGNRLCSLSFQRLAQAFDATACPLLEYINVENNIIGAQGLTETEAILPPGLKYLNFRDNEIGDEGLSQLAVLLEAGGCPKLETLYLGMNGIGEEGLLDLNKALLSGNLKCLTSIELSSNTLAGTWLPAPDLLGLHPPQENGLRGFAAALEAGSCPNIATLRLDDIDMSNNGLKALAKAFKAGYCQSLTHLNLEGNSIGDDGITSLGEALKTKLCSQLKDLILDGCENITSAACRQFLSVFAEGCCPNLAKLNLRGLEITNSSVKGLAKAISSGSLSNLETLSLEYTNVGNAGLNSLVDAFSKCPCPKLRELKLRCSSVANDGTRALMTLLLDSDPEIVLPALKEVRQSLGAHLVSQLECLLVNLQATDLVSSEKLRRMKARLARLRPDLSILY